MADAAQPATGQGGKRPSAVVIPDELRKKHPDLIELILGSESMNDEERQYWINILPIMSPEQIQSLRDILENEKRQLAAIDRKYAKEIEKIGQAQFVKKTQEDRHRRQDELKQKEGATHEKEEEATDEILKQIEGQ